MTIGEKQKKLFKIKKCQKMPKKSNIFSLKIPKGAGIFKKLQKTSQWSQSYFKNVFEGDKIILLF